MGGKNKFGMAMSLYPYSSYEGLLRENCYMYTKVVCWSDYCLYSIIMTYFVAFDTTLQ